MDITIKELRKFGIIMGFLIVLFFGILIPKLKNYEVNYIPFLIACVFFICGVFFPGKIKWFYSLWMKVGMVFGKINTFIILVMLFYFVFFPIGLFMKFIKRDSLNEKLTNDKSYKIKSTKDNLRRLEVPY